MLRSIPQVNESRNARRFLLHHKLRERIDHRQCRSNSHRGAEIHANEDGEFGRSGTRRERRIHVDGRQYGWIDEWNGSHCGRQHARGPDAHVG